MSEQHNRPGRGAGRWVRVVLAVSLAVNLLVVGLVIGAILRFGGSHGVRGLPPEAIGMAMFRELPSADRRALRTRAAENRVHFGASRRAGAGALGDALRVTPFDAGAVAAVLAAQVTHRSEAQRALHAAWLDRVTAMSDEQRLQYADRLQAALSHRHNRPNHD